MDKQQIMPALFIGHGNPMNAITENQFVKGFRDVAAKIPKPKSILCISAHWYKKGTEITAMEQPKTIHDFGGFPQELFEVQYPAKGNPQLAEEIKNLLQDFSAELDYKWGLDHGTWTVLRHMYPLADIPVIQLSIDYTKEPEYHYKIAQKLVSLREQGILILGSGNIVHNLRLVDFYNFEKENYGFDWAVEAREILNNYLLKGDYQPLLDYKKLPKSVQTAIPTPDHFLPLIYTLGVQMKQDKLSLFNDVLVAGSLSMTSVLLS